MSWNVNQRREMHVIRENGTEESAASKSMIGLAGGKRTAVAMAVARGSQAVLALFAVAVLGACANSPDSHYYTLTESGGANAGNSTNNGPASNTVAQATASELGTGSVGPGMSARTAPGGVNGPSGMQTARPLLIEVMPVNVPSQVSRPEIVTTSRDGKVDIHDYNRWASPLDDEIGNALSQGLTHRLGAINTYRTPRPPGSTAYQITVNVQRFVSIPDDSASIDAVWSVVRSSDQLTLTCRTTASEPITHHGFEHLAAAQRIALSRVTDQIAQGVRIELPVPVLKTSDISVAAPASSASSSTAKGKDGHAMSPPAARPKPVLPVLSCPY